MKKAIQDLTRQSPIGNIELDVYKKNRSGVKLRDLNSLDALKEVLRYCIVLVGIKKENLPSEAQKAVIIDFLIARKGGFAAEEIKEAFLMAVDGRLNVDVSNYQSFDAVYISKVLSAYKKFNTERGFHLKNEEKEVELTESQKEAIVDTFLLEVCNQYETSLKSRRNEVRDPYGVVYDQLHKLNLIKPSKEEKIAFFEKAKKIISVGNIADKNDRKIYSEFVNSSYIGGDGDKTNIYFVKCKQLSKSMITDVYVKKWIKEKYDLRAFLKEYRLKNEKK